MNLFLISKNITSISLENIAGNFFNPNGHVFNRIDPSGHENVQISCDLFDRGI